VLIICQTCPPCQPKHVQALTSKQGALLARGEAKRIGAWTVTAAARVRHLPGAAASVISVPFDRFYKMHDLAATEIRTEYVRAYRESGGTPPPFLRFRSRWEAGANMVLLQARRRPDAHCRCI
jgi:hypothetical protein